MRERPAFVSSLFLLVALLATLLASPTLQAQPLPTQERGLSADTGYHASGLDQVNLFNGQNVVHIPLGEAYPVGPNLSYALAVVYNSGGWTYDERSCNGEDYALPEPQPRANAGFGWSLELGGLQSPAESASGRWTYLSPDGSNDNRHGWSYALPFTRCAPGEGYDPAGPFLSQEIYAGSRDSGTKLRSTWVEYGSDGVGGGEQQEKNHRLRYQKVVYHDDGERYRETVLEDYDGLGHFRRVTARGNLSVGDERITEIDFNSARGTLVVDPATGSAAGSSFLMPAKSDPWVLGTFHEQRVSEDGETAIVEACFDSGTGFLRRLRTLSGPSRSGADLLSVFAPETSAGQSTGRVARELFYGGDAQGAMDVTYPDLCAMTLPAAPQNELEHAYDSGVLVRTAWLDPCDGAEILRVTDLDVDAATGLPTRRRDVSGVATDYVFDVMGRLLSERPAEEAWTSYEYRLSSLAAPTALPRVTIERCPAGQAGCTVPLGWERRVFDGLGRPLSVLRQVPEDSGLEIAERSFEWNALGWKTMETEWHAQGAEAPPATVFSAHDRFGRVGRVAPPGQPAIRFTFEGDRTVTRESRVINAYAGRGGRISERQTRFFFNGNGATFAYETGFEYETTGRLAAVDYPQCLHHAGDPPCAGSAPARRVSYEHQRGFLTGVTGYAPRIDYQAGGALHSVEHQNGVVTTIDLDPQTGRGRPHRISTTAGWDTGTYDFDGEGNVHRIGAQRYRYDRLNRMVEGQTQVAGQVHVQAAVYDDYGNLLQLVSDGNAQSLPVDPSTNRLTLAGTAYDAAGNLTRLVIGGETFEYAFDAVGAMRHLRSDTDLARNFIYNADDERLAIFDCVNGDCETQGSGETWTLRGLDGQVLREYRHPWNAGWSWARDYVYREGQLLAAVEPTDGGGEATSFLHLDHLGTPRQVTGAGGQQEALHSYHPFGREITGTGQDEIPLKFTGHERDLNGQGARGDLDYMHARFASPFLGRFLSFDPVGGNPRSGQSWNRYSYVLGNPVKYTDPYGLTPRFTFGDSITVYATISDSIPTGLLSLVAFGNFLRDGLPTAFGFLDVANARNFYQNLAYQQIQRGNFAAAVGTEFLLNVLPETQAEFGVLLATSVLLSAKVTGAVVSRGGGILREASEAAFRAADDIASFIPKSKHLLGGGSQSKARFATSSLDEIRSIVQEALRSPSAQFLPNPNLPGTFRVVTDLGRPIGVKGQQAVRVIGGLDGKVINAFPVHLR